MFSRSNSPRNRFAFVLGIAAFGLSALMLMGGTAAAFEGIQGQYAIFYPSIELLYYHTDNLFLTPNNEVDANTFLARPKFRLEIPTDRHYFSLEYIAQYRDIDEFHLDQQFSHFANLKGVFQASPVFRVEIDDNFARGVLEVEEVDPDSELVLGLDPFTKNDARLAFVWEGQRQGANLNFGHHLTNFDRNDPTEANPGPAFLETDILRAGIEYFYKFTPLSSFNIGYRYADNSEDFASNLETEFGDCVGGPCLGVASLDSTSNEVYIGFQGELGRTSTGRIDVGYRSTDFSDITASDFQSLTVDGTFTKAFTRYTKLEVNLHRRESFSNFEDNAYYTGNRISLALTNQPLGRKVFWTIAGGFQRNDYPDPINAGTIAVPDLINREDDIIMARAEVGYFPLTHLNVKVNYRFEDRDSNLPNNAFDYQENAIIFELGLGF